MQISDSTSVFNSGQQDSVFNSTSDSIVTSAFDPAGNARKGSSRLLLGWEEGQDDTGRRFDFNDQMMESRWDVPSASSLPAESIGVDNSATVTDTPGEGALVVYETERANDFFVAGRTYDAGEGEQGAMEAVYLRDGEAAEDVTTGHYPVDVSTEYAASPAAADATSRELMPFAGGGSREVDESTNVFAEETAGGRASQWMSLQDGASTSNVTSEDPDDVDTESREENVEEKKLGSSRMFARKTGGAGYVAQWKSLQDSQSSSRVTDDTAVGVGSAIGTETEESPPLSDRDLVNDITEMKPVVGGVLWQTLRERYAAEWLSLKEAGPVSVEADIHNSGTGTARDNPAIEDDVNELRDERGHTFVEEEPAVVSEPDYYAPRGYASPSDTEEAVKTARSPDAILADDSTEGGPFAAALPPGMPRESPRGSYEEELVSFKDSASPPYVTGHDYVAAGGGRSAKTRNDAAQPTFQQDGELFDDVSRDTPIIAGELLGENTIAGEEPDSTKSTHVLDDGLLVGDTAGSVVVAVDEEPCALQGAPPESPFDVGEDYQVGWDDHYAVGNEQVTAEPALPEDGGVVIDTTAEMAEGSYAVAAEHASPAAANSDAAEPMPVSKEASWTASGTTAEDNRAVEKGTDETQGGHASSTAGVTAERSMTHEDVESSEFEIKGDDTVAGGNPAGGEVAGGQVIGESTLIPGRSSSVTDSTQDGPGVGAGETRPITWDENAGELGPLPDSREDVSIEDQASATPQREQTSHPRHITHDGSGLTTTTQQAVGWAVPPFLDANAVDADLWKEFATDEGAPFWYNSSTGETLWVPSDVEQ